MGVLGDEGWSLELKVLTNASGKGQRKCLACVK